MLKNLIKVSIAVGALIGIIVIVFSITNNPKTPATADQVWTILETQGFEPADTTQLYKDEWGNIGNSLSEVVSMESGDIRFDFFVFNNTENAEVIRKRYQSYIRDNRYHIPNVKVSEGAANYMIYTLKANGMYSVNIRVGNTLIFAYSDEENASKIDNIILEMDYFR